jgi:hypothetical protein
MCPSGVVFLDSHQSPTLGAHTHAHAHAHPYHGFCVGMDVMLLFMGGHGWAWVRYYCSWVGIGLCIPASNSKSESNFSDARNTLTKKRSGLKPTTMNDFLFVQSNQDLVYAGNTHYTIFEYTGAI